MNRQQQDFERGVSRRFTFDRVDVRGEVVSVQNLTKIFAANGYPLHVRSLLGELAAAAVMMSSTLKFEGIMTLQAKGDGPLSLLMVECTNRKNWRALARWRQAPQSEDSKGWMSLLGQGQLTITVDPDKGKRYQGIVPLYHTTLAEGLNDYFASSEQLPTRLWLACDGDSGCGILLQSMPAAANSTEESRGEIWTRLITLTDTVSWQEMLSLDHHSLLTRLYHEENIRAGNGEEVQFRCNCSRERTARALLSLGQEQINEMLLEQKAIEMSCQFCLATYRFTAEDVKKILQNAATKPH